MQIDDRLLRELRRFTIAVWLIALCLVAVTGGVAYSLLWETHSSPIPVPAGDPASTSRCAIEKFYQDMSALMERGKYKEIISAADARIKECPSDHYAWWFKAKALAIEEQWDPAVASRERSTPLISAFFYSLVRAQRMAGRAIVLGTAALLAFGASPPTVSAEPPDLSSPERTLGAYIRSLRSGDLAGVKATLDRPEVEFYLPKPISISSYRVTKRIVYGVREANDWNSKGIIPPARAGDVELHVRKIIGGKSQMVSYNFRSIGGEWRLYSSAVWGAD